MAIIRPCADLRNNYNEISRICHETQKPIYITKNGANDLVILSDKAYEDIIKEKEETLEERVDRLVAEKFEKHYDTFEEFHKDVWTKIEKGLKDVDEGRYQALEDFCAEMEEEYGFNK